MDNKKILKCSPGVLSKDFENIQAVTVVLQNTEKDLRTLKTLIRDLEQKSRKGTLKVNSPVFRKRHKNAPIVISRVCKKFLLLRNIHEEPVLLYKNKCPDWLLVAADGYSAIGESLFEIREELKQLCNKFLTQKKNYFKIHEERSQCLSEFMQEMKELEQKMEIEKTTVGEYITQLTQQVEEKKSGLEQYKEKMNKLKDMNENIQSEIQKVADKYWAVDATLRYESEFGKGFKVKIEENNTRAMQEEEFLQKLRGDLEVALRNVEQLRYSKDIYMYKKCESIRYLQYLINQESERVNYIKELLIRKGESKEYFTCLKITKNEEKETNDNKLNEKQEELLKIQDEVKTKGLELEETLDKKKRVQETYQTALENMCSFECKHKLEKYLKELELDKIQKELSNVKRDDIVPMKLEINSYKENVRLSYINQEKVQEKLQKLEKKDSEMRMECLVIKHIKIKVLFFEFKNRSGVQPEDTFSMIDDITVQWNANNEEYKLASKRIQIYKSRILKLKERLAKLCNELEKERCQLPRLQMETKRVAIQYISMAPLGFPIMVAYLLSGVANKVRKGQRAASNFPKTGKATTSAKAGTNCGPMDSNTHQKLWKQTTMEHLTTSSVSSANEQIYSNFGKFLFL